MSELSIAISNVGGIDYFEQTFSDSVTVITGSNASNKTSLLQAIAFGLGRSTVPIRNGASEARVELEIDGQHVVRTAESKGKRIVTSGDGLLEEPGDTELFERFACLFEFNDIRRAIREERSVEELLKEPMDLNALESHRSDLINQKEALKSDVDKLTDVEQEIDSKQSELSTTRERIEKIESKLDDLLERQADSSNDNEGVSELREERASLVHEQKNHEQQIEELKSATDRLEVELKSGNEDLEAAREEARSVDIKQLRSEHEEIRTDIDDIIERIEVLQSVLTANREMLNSSYTGILGQESALAEDKVNCWACGNEAFVSEFEETIEELTEFIERNKQQRSEYQPRLEEIEGEIDVAKQAERRVRALESTIHEREDSLESRRDSLETKRESLKEIRERLEGIDERIAEHESEQLEEVSALQDQIEELRVDLHAKQSKANKLETSILDLQELLTEREHKKDEIDALTGEITSLTDRIQTLEQDLREGFNDAISDLVEILDYDQIERIWIDGNFDLIVAREVDSVVRQDEISHLSESEREMVSLMLALAGYIAYDVSDLAPILLVDTLGAFDSERTAKLISYFGEKTPYLIASMLPDSAAMLDSHSTETAVVEPKTETPSP